MKMRYVRRLKKARKKARREKAKEKGRGWSSRDRAMVRKRLLKRDGDLCALCGTKMDTSDPMSPRYATIDHVQPLSRGGSNKTRNLKLACRACNNARGNAPFETWLPYDP